MSRTKRKDHYIEKHGEPLFGEEWQATRDKKKWYKPSNNQKKGHIGKVRTSSRSKLKNAVQKADPENGPILPVEKKTDTWNFN